MVKQGFVIGGLPGGDAAAGDIAMAVDVFGERFHGEIGAEARRGGKR